MISRARIAAYLTAFSILLPLVMLYAYGQGTREKGLFVFHACLLTGIAAIYWFHGFMYFVKRKKAEPTTTFQECLQDLFFPLTLLVMVTVLVTGFFSVADELHMMRSMSIATDRSFPYAARFSIAVIEVFPETRFPVGVAAYAFWGAFAFNNFNFIQRFSQFTGIGKYTYTPLTVIDGITLQVEERLLESGIDSIQALATANPKDLKDPKGKGLPYPENMVKEWIDQARLAVYFYDEEHFAVIRSLGIRTYTAMQQYQAQVKQSPEILDRIDPQPIPKDSFRHLVLYGQFP